MPTDICPLPGVTAPGLPAGACKIGQGMYVASGRAFLAGTRSGTRNGCDSNLMIDCATDEYFVRVASARGFIPLGSARYDAGAGPLVDANHPITPGAPINFATANYWVGDAAAPLTVTNPFSCPLNVLLGYDMGFQATTRADLVGYRIFAGCRITHVGPPTIHASVNCATTFVTAAIPGAITIITPGVSSANPLGNTANEALPAITLAPNGSAGDTAQFDSLAATEVYIGAPAPTDLRSFFTSAIRVYGFI